MGSGHALFDQLVFDQGQMINGTLLDYQLPSLKDMPDKLTPIIVESAHKDGPFGAKGVGESGILADRAGLRQRRPRRRRRADDPTPAHPRVRPGRPLLRRNTMR